MSWPDWLTPRRAWDFILKVVRLEQTIGALEDDNRRLRVELDRIDRQMIETNARVSLLVDFVKDALSDRIDRRVDDAVRRAIGDDRQIRS